MVQINLSTSRTRKRPGSKAGLDLKVNLSPLFVCLGVTVFVVATAWVMLNMQILAKEKKLKSLDVQLSDLQVTLGKVKDLDKEKKALKKLYQFRALIGLHNNYKKDLFLLIDY